MFGLISGMAVFKQAEWPSGLGEGLQNLLRWFESTLTPPGYLNFKICN